MTEQADVRVVSIGAMSANPFWGERAPARTGHATTTLVRAGASVVVVDPGLPAQIVAARLGERAGIAPEAVTHVFLTSFQPDTIRGLGAFEGATWWLHPDDRAAVEAALSQGLARAVEARDTELRAALERDIALLDRCGAPPDELERGVAIFPLPGATPGTCGVIVSEPSRTTLVTGDAIPTRDHLTRAQAPASCVDAALAKESVAEAIEIADFIIPGRDNLAPSPVRTLAR